MSTMLFRNATVITVDAERRVLEPGSVLVEDRDIVAVGSTEEVEDSHPLADRVIEAAGRVIAPGFVSTHNHVGYTIFRGRAEDVGLDCVTGQYFPMATVVTREERRAIGALTYSELLRSGVTTFLEMEEEVDVYADFVDRLGVRSAMGVMVHDVDVESMRSGEYRFSRELRARQLAQATAFAEHWHGRAEGRIQAVMTPNMSISSSPELLQGLRAVADRLGLRLSIHLGWGPQESRITRRIHGVDAFDYVHRHRLLGSDVVAAHCYVVEESDVERLAATGTHVAHCPLMNAVRGHIAPVVEYRERGIPVSLAIDNMFSDYFEVVRASVMMARIKTRNPVAISAADGLELATIAGARALGLDDRIGSLEVGKRADLIVVDFRRFGLRPTLDAVQNLVYHARRDDVETVLVDGRILVHEGKVRSVDAFSLIEPAHAAATRAWSRFISKYGGILAR